MTDQVPSQKPNKKPTLPRLLIAFAKAHGPYNSYRHELETLLPKINDVLKEHSDIELSLCASDEREGTVLLTSAGEKHEIFAFKYLGKYWGSERSIYEAHVGGREVLVGGTIDAMRLRVVLNIAAVLPDFVKPIVEESLIKLVEEATGEAVLPEKKVVVEFSDSDYQQAEELKAALAVQGLLPNPNLAVD